MKIQFIKIAGGMLAPASDIDADSMSKFKTGEQYEVEIKNYRNPDFHRKMFAFFNHCFAHWKSDREFMDERGQFDMFRKHMTVLAGYYDEYYKLDGAVRIEAKSIAYASMTPEDFEALYQALIQVAMQRIFTGSDEEVYNQLVGFF